MHTWYYTETGKRLGAAMLDDLAVYIDELEAEAAAAAGLGRRRTSAHAAVRRPVDYCVTSRSAR